MSGRGLFGWENEREKDPTNHHNNPIIPLSRICGDFSFNNLA